MDINKLSLEEKVGQLFIVGRKSEETDDIYKLIEECKVGSIILYKKNYSNYKEMVDLVNNIKKVNSKNKIPLFFSIDQEGGRVNRMPSEILNVPSATKLAKTENMNIVKESGIIIGEMLRKTGINMNYGPILDIRRFKEKHPIGDRCFGEKSMDVEKYAIPVLKEMKSEKVLSVVKHFPGHGLTNKDSHFQFPKITEKIEKVEQEDMEVFKTAIDNGADAVMVGHLMLKDVDSKYPASISKKIIQKYLKEKYNFKGLIITDDLKMWAIRIHFNVKKAALRAIEAGNDMVMMGFSYKTNKKIIDYIIKQVKKGNLSEERINASVEKIIEMKEKYNANNELVEGINIEKINNKIKNIREKVMI